MGEKTSCLLDKKVRRKNRIPEYHTPSPDGYNEDWYVNNQSMKNLLTQWDTEEENWKISEMWLVKNLIT